MSFSLAHVCVCVLSPTLFATSWTVACQASQSTGCLRQEYRKVKVKVKIDQSCLTLCDPMDHTVHGILQARILEKVALPFSRRSSQPRDWTQVSCIAGGFFTSWVTGKPKNIGVSCHFLFRGSFPPRDQTQVSCVSCIAGRFFTTELPAKPVGYLEMHD